MLYRIKSGNTSWLVTYDKAIRKDGSLFFPDRLNKEFLMEQRKVLGPYIFANQYMNEIIPAEDQDFKKSWLKYYEVLPANKHTFIFIDPAISQQDHADFTAYVVVHVDSEGYWYVEAAKRQRINATETVRLIFQLNEFYRPQSIGIEVVAYQQALLHFLDEEMRRRGVVLPVQGVKRGTDKSKEQRILSLVPRFEWGRVFLHPGLNDFEDEYTKFPRSAYDDILDALASIDEIAYKPQKGENDYAPKSPNDRNYEKWYIEQLGQGKDPGRNAW